MNIIFNTGIFIIGILVGFGIGVIIGLGILEKRIRIYYKLTNKKGNIRGNHEWS